MEWFDIVDADDTVTGKAPRDRCHADPSLMHRVVHLALQDQKGNILLTKRNPALKFDPGMWCVVGEHVITGETWDHAFRRAVSEELGIGDDLPYAAYGPHVFRYATQCELARFFLVQWNGQPIKPDSKEISEIRWVGRGHIPPGVSDITAYWLERVFGGNRAKKVE